MHNGDRGGGAIVCCEVETGVNRLGEVINGTPLYYCYTVFILTKQTNPAHANPGTSNRT